MPELDSSLFVRAAGPSDAPAVVFLHGGGASGWMWQPVIERLPGYQCLAVDLPEQGNSRSAGAFSMLNAAEKVAEFIRSQVPGGCAHVVGLSEGAQVAVQLLAVAPERVNRAVISSALLQPMPGTAWMNSPGMWKWTYRLAMAPFKNNDWWIRLNMKYAAGIPESYFTDFKKEFQNTTEDGFVHLMTANQSFRLPFGLDRITIPTLIVVGKKEYAAMKQSARGLARVLPNAQAVQVDLGKGSSLAAEHNWALTAPELFALTVQAWIESNPLPIGNGLEAL
jgi:pimeloyl-ACP methyl ester carboxylesterase